MKNIIIKSLLTVSLLIFNLTCTVSANDMWHNDLRSKFLNNETVIMEINIRSFNSEDDNKDGFIQEEKGEKRGTFLNGIERLDELKNIGVNTLHILPITPTGKLKALGTAGSLYSAASFNSINEDLIDKDSQLDNFQQAKEFINQAHKRGISVIVDVPACGSYDLYLQRPDLFASANTHEPIVPSDWTDVRLLAVGTEDKIDSNVYGLYKDFVKLMLNLGVDGIRADVAHSKTALFWKELINYSRNKDPEFLWLAESSESWHDAISPHAPFTPYNKLLEAGFDGYYGSFFNLKNWNNAKDLHNQISFTLGETKKFSNKKSVIGAFTTHDEVSPIILKGEKLSDMMIWLNATLPVNTYFPDGFQTGDTYYYPNGNQKAENSNTDDDIYFTHKGQIDIFNFSRKPEGNILTLKKDFILANNVKKSILPVLNSGVYTPLKTSDNEVFAYQFDNGVKKVITVGNLNFNSGKKVTVKVPKYNTEKQKFLPIKISSMPDIKNGKIFFELNPGETNVIILSGLSNKK